VDEAKQVPSRLAEKFADTVLLLPFFIVGWRWRKQGAVFRSFSVPIPASPDTRRPRPTPPELRPPSFACAPGCSSAGEGEDPSHFANSAVPHFPQLRNRLQPTETFFDALPFPLADLISRVPRGAPRRWRCHPRGHGFAPHAASPTVTVFVPRSCSSITSAASRSVVPLACKPSISTISHSCFLLADGRFHCAGD